MCGAINLLPLYAFMAWTWKTLAFSTLLIFLVHTDRMLIIVGKIKRKTSKEEKRKKGFSLQT
jgi:hypothetical protein